MTTHEWRERDDDGRLVFYRAKHHAGEWTFQSRPKGETRWTRFAPEEVSIEVLKTFRDILWNKAQRRRVPPKQVDQIDALIASLEPAEGDSPEE